MNIPERLLKLRELMAEKGIYAYVVPTADFHQSEYVGEYFKARKFITNFSGSAGVAVITLDEANLWTDGRYFVQCGIELQGTTVGLMKMGEPGVPTINEYLADKLPEGGVLGFDGRVIAMGEGQGYEAIVAAKGGKIIYDYDLIDAIWEDRPAMSTEPVFALGLEYTGESTASKLARIREEMAKKGANNHVLTTLDDICWVLNIRGNDVAFSPLVLAYLNVKTDKVELYMDESKLSEEIKASFAADGIEVLPYNDIYENIKALGAEDTLLIDAAKLNYALYKNISADVTKVEARNPEVLFKGVKNEVEVENIKKAQLKDSVAHVRFMKWLKENVEKEVITELSATDKLDGFREEMGNFIRPSFAPISSYGEHAAIVHYSSSEETNVQLVPGSLYLSDTGAGFIEGSTDITRTFAIGEVPAIMKEHFTVTAMSNLRLANAKFLKGAVGMNLDMIARAPFWERNLNYNHGTGHGMGYLLSIHEGPAGIRWMYRAADCFPFQSGMIVTDEPGVYIEGSHGVRLENDLLVREGVKNEYGQFMYFEKLTYIPFDLDAIDPEIMTCEDRALLNEYHAQVFEKVSPYLNEEEKAWLANYTRAI